MDPIEEALREEEDGYSNRPWLNKTDALMERAPGGHLALGSFESTYSGTGDGNVGSVIDDAASLAVLNPNAKYAYRATPADVKAQEARQARDRKAGVDPAIRMAAHMRANAGDFETGAADAMAARAPTAARRDPFMPPPEDAAPKATPGAGARPFVSVSRPTATEPMGPPKPEGDSPVVAPLPKSPAQPIDVESLRAALATRQRPARDWMGRLGSDIIAAVRRKPADYSASEAMDQMNVDAANEPIRALAREQAAQEAELKRRETEALIGERDARAKSLLTPKPVAVDPTRQGTLAERERHNREMERIAASKAGRTAGGSTLDANGRPVLNAAQTAIDDRDVAKRRDANKQALAKQLADQTSLASSLRELEALAPGVTSGDESKMPGWGGLSLAGTPGIGRLASDDTRNVAQAQRKLKMALTLAQTGKASNAQEQSEMKAYLGMDLLADPRLFARAAAAAKRALLREVKARAAAFGKTGGPEDRYAVLDDVLAATPDVISENDPLFGGSGQPAAAPPSTPAKAPPTPKLADVVKQLGPPPAGKRYVVRGGKVGAVSTPRDGDVEIL